MSHEIFDLVERVQLAIKVGESHYREFKSAWHRSKGGQTPRDVKDVMRDVAGVLVAFANADGGELLIGVEDDGAISGVPFDEDGVRSILSAPETHVHPQTPLPRPLRSRVEIEGQTVLYFCLPKGVEYVYQTTDGRCLRRVDRDSVPFSAEGVIADRIEDESRRWDRQVVEGATLQDLDLGLVESVAAQIAYGVSAEKCLQYLDLAEFTPSGLKLKQAAVALFASDIRKWHPRCQVRIMTVQGKERRSGEAFNVLQDIVVPDNILRLVDSAWNALTAALTRSTQFTESARFEETKLFPQIACREGLVNAVVHRNYAIDGRGIEISIFTDRMEITSPGMLLSSVSLEDLRALKGIHESRNPLIARVLREVGLVREMGEGLKRIYEVMRSNALAEPELESDTTGFTITLYNKSMYEADVKLWLSTFDTYTPTQSQMAVLALGYGGKAFSTQDVIDRLGIVDIGQVTEIISPLRKEGIVQRTLRGTRQFNEAHKRGIPNREVPVYRVVGAPPVDRRAEPAAAGPAADPAEEQAREHRLFIGHLPDDLTSEELAGFLARTCAVVSLSMPPGAAGSANKGFAFATLSWPGTMDDLVRSLTGSVLAGRRIHVEPQRDRVGVTADEPAASEADTEGEGRLHQLYIANIAPDVDRVEVLEFLTDVCQVVALSMPRNLERTSHRGFAFATATFAGSTRELVVGLDGRLLVGRRLHVRELRTPQHRSTTA